MAWVLEILDMLILHYKGSMLGICLTMGIKCGLKVYMHKYLKASLEMRANLIVFLKNLIFFKFNFY